MSMHYLANVAHLETDMGVLFYTPHAHVCVDHPIEDNPNYFVLVGIGAGESRNFARFDQAMDYAARVLKQAEPA